ncbi:putative RNA-dependent RNA polymerase [Freshwater macrophyte associated bunya-like virus 1]|nr:putative RNA-dependent RNA polymerase [Freshwater macrophyte associated bunya-like virus 1]
MINTFILIFILIMTSILNTSRVSDLKKSTINKYYEYLSYTTIRFSNNKMSFKLFLNNTDKLMEVEFQVMNGLLYTHKDANKVVTARMLSDNFNFYMCNADLYKDSEFIIPVDKMAKSKMFNTFKLSLEQYMTLTNLRMVKGKVLLDFYVSASTLKRFPAAKFQNPGKFELGDKSIDKIRENLDLMVTESYTRAFKRETIYSKDDLMSFATSLSRKGEITKAEVSTYMYNRHEMFARLVMYYTKNITDTDTDTSIGDFFKYEGIYSRLTPDFIFRESDGSYHMVEFAWTDARYEDVLSRKLDKYEEARIEASMMMKIEKSDVMLSVVVMDSNSMICRSNNSEFELPTATLKQIMPNIFYMKNLVESIPNYAYAKKQLQDDEEVDLDLRVLSLLTTINNLECKMVVKKTKAPMISESYKTMDKDKDKTFKAVMEDPMIMEAKKFVNNHYMNDRKYIDFFMDAGKKDLLCHEIASMATCKYSDIEKLINALMLKEEKKRFRAKLDKDGNIISKVAKKIPKWFKVPVMRGDTMDYNPVDITCNVIDTLEDGTWLLPAEIYDKEESVEDREGIGMCLEDEEEVELFLKEYLESVPTKNLLERFKNTKLYEMLETMEDIATNIAYLEGRRWILQNSKGTKEKTSVYKKFGNYAIQLSTGSRLTAEKQIRYRVFIRLEDTDDDVANPFMHTYYKFDGKYFCTKWLSISAMDLKHYCTVKSTCELLVVNQMTKMEENNFKMENYSMARDYPIWTAVPILLMMEHKRGTSTTAQLNRYVFHSFTAIMSDKKSMLKTICDDPVRSTIESYIRLKQLSWAKMMFVEGKFLWKEFRKNMMDSNGMYDKWFIPSFYDLTVSIEFEMMMDEMYYGNLFDYNMGFKGHRQKMMYKKMADEEINWRSVKSDPKSKGVSENLNWILDKDKHHLFDRDFIINSVMRWNKKEVSKSNVMKALSTSLRKTCEDSMMMTISLKDTRTLLQEEIKETSFEALYGEFTKILDMKLMSMMKDEEWLAAHFSTFTKNQIGGVREILIQWVRLRVYVKFMETFFRELCKFEDKEMLTDDKHKKEIQATFTRLLKEDYIKTQKGETMSIKFPFSINMDSSKWAPSMVMMQYVYFVMALKLPKEVEELFLTVLSAFSDKKLIIPLALREKWMKKPATEKEEDPLLEMVRREAERNNWVWTVESGMGQGMLHYLSSFYHVLIDDECDYIINNVVAKTMAGKAKFKSQTMLSSDDITKMVQMEVFSGKDMTMSLFKYLSMETSLKKLGNIHINWKKTAVHFVVTEFNSNFSIGKRVCWATIKDIYTAIAIPDMTYPERAVKEVISGFKRMFMNGVTLPVINHGLSIMRKKLMEWYTFNNDKVLNLTKLLNCKEEELPFQLGFVPTDMVIETLMFGPEIHMFKEMSEELKTFYRGMFTAELASPLTMESEDIFALDEEDMMTGRYIIELKSRLDSTLKDMKRRFYADKDIDKIRDDMYKNSLMYNRVENSKTQFVDNTNEYFISMNRKYEFQETMRLHSLVRALQLSNKEFYVIGFKEERKEYNLMKFVNYILTDTKENPSCIEMYSNLKVHVNNHYKIMEEMTMTVAKRIFRHPKFRTLNFYSAEITTYASEKEILDVLFCDNLEPKFRVVNCLKKFAETINVDYEKLLRNPVKIILKRFKYGNESMNVFTKFLKYFCETMKFKKVSMLSDEPDSGNVYSNMRSLYSTKLKPGFVIKSSELASTQESRLFITSMSLGVNFDSSLINSDTSWITMADDKATQAMKIYCMSDGNELDCSNIKSDVVFFKKLSNLEVTNLYWFDFNTFVNIKLWEEKFKIEAEMFIVTKEEVSENMKSVLLMELKRLKTLGIKVFYDKQMVSSWDDLVNCMEWTNELGMVKVDIFKGPEKWTSSFVYENVRFNIFTNHFYYDDESLEILKKSNITEEQLEKLSMLNEINFVQTFEEIDDYMEKMGIKKEFNLYTMKDYNKEANKKKKESDMKNTSQAMMEFFGEYGEDLTFEDMVGGANLKEFFEQNKEDLMDDSSYEDLTAVSEDVKLMEEKLTESTTEIEKKETPEVQMQNMMKVTMKDLSDDLFSDLREWMLESETTERYMHFNVMTFTNESITRMVRNKVRQLTKERLTIDKRKVNTLARKGSHVILSDILSEVKELCPELSNHLIMNIAVELLKTQVLMYKFTFGKFFLLERTFFVVVDKDYEDELMSDLMAEYNTAAMMMD